MEETKYARVLNLDMTFTTISKMKKKYGRLMQRDGGKNLLTSLRLWIRR